MAVGQRQFDIDTRGNDHILNITEAVQRAVDELQLANGLATVFVVGSTAAITTTEYEPGLVSHDLAAAFEVFAPRDGNYRHEATWHDDNGHSHVRASMLGPSLSVPVIEGKLPLGTWQQIVLIDFDTRPRRRQILVQVIGE